MVDHRLIALYMTTTVMMMTFGLLTPFLPLLAEEKQVSSAEIGLIFGVFPAGSLISSPIVGVLLYKFGRRNTLLATYLMSVVGFFASGVSVYMGKEGFVVANILSRFLTGAAAGTMFTVENAVIASDYPDKVFKYVGINESCVGVGFLVGPMIGAGLYLALGAAGTFFSFAGFFLLFGLIVYAVLGKDRPYRIVSKGQNFFALALEPRIIITQSPLVFYMFSFGGIIVFFPTHLKDYGLSDAWVVASYTLTGAGYLLVCIVLAHTLENMNKTIVNCIGLLVGIVGVALIGPFPSFLPQHVATVLIGWGVLPLCSGALFVIIIPSLIEVATVDLGLVHDDKLIDKLSGSV